MIERSTFTGDHNAIEAWAVRMLQDLGITEPRMSVFEGDVYGVYINPDRLAEIGVRSTLLSTTLVKAGEDIVWDGRQFYRVDQEPIARTNQYEGLFARDEREQRQPRWVQEKFHQLRVRLKETLERITTADPRKSQVVIDPHSDHPIYIEGRPGVKLRFENGDEVDVQIERERNGNEYVSVHATGGMNNSMLVLPQAANAIIIKVGR